MDSEKAIFYDLHILMIFAYVFTSFNSFLLANVRLETIQIFACNKIQEVQILRPQSPPLNDNIMISSKKTTESDFGIQGPVHL